MDGLPLDQIWFYTMHHTLSSFSSIRGTAVRLLWALPGVGDFISFYVTLLYPAAAAAVYMYNGVCTE